MVGAAVMMSAVAPNHPESWRFWWNERAHGWGSWSLARRANQTARWAAGMAVSTTPPASSIIITRQGRTLFTISDGAYTLSEHPKARRLRRAWSIEP